MLESNIFSPISLKVLLLNHRMRRSFCHLVLYDLPYISSVLTPSLAQPSLKEEKKNPVATKLLLVNWPGDVTKGSEKVFVFSALGL